MYKVTQAEDFLNLSLNENYFSFCPLSELKLTTLNRYPNTEKYKEIQKQASTLYGVDNKKILLTNGSDDGIFLIQQWFARECAGKNIIITNPTFSMYENYANNLGLKIIKHNLGEDLKINIPELIEIITKNDSSAVFIPNPNSPTGIMLNTNEIEAILQTNIPVIIDEAYIEFSGKKSSAVLLDKYKNLIILRTLSKFYGLASARIGFVIGNSIPDISKFQAPFSISAFNSEVALHTLEYIIDNGAKILSFRKQFIQDREDFLQALLQKSNVVKIYGTETNFVLFEVKNLEKVLDNSNVNKLLVKDFSKILPNCIRVSLGEQKINGKILECV